MTVTYRDLFHKIAQIRKAYKVPLRIDHLTQSDSLKKADEAFWDYKCEHNLDFPFRYSELHRIINVSKGLQLCTTVSTSCEIIEEYDLISLLINRGLVYRSCAISKENSIISNYMDDKSIIAMRTISHLSDLRQKEKIHHVEYLLLQDWICGVPLTTTLIYAQLSDDFEVKFKMKPRLLLTSCATILKKRADNFLYKKFCKHIKEEYYGCKQEIFHNAKTRSQKITG
jgi:hypothetical protein